MYLCRDTEEQKQGLIDMLEYMTQVYADAGRSLAMGTCVEIGTYIGEAAAIFSKYFYQVHTIDPWDTEFVSAIAGERMTEQDILTEYYAHVDACPNVVQIKKPSLLAARDFEDNTLDLVYIDGWHHYSVVVADIMTWLPKVRQGGWIGGHDYHTKLNSQVIPAVKAMLSAPDRVFKDYSWIKRVT